MEKKEMQKKEAPAAGNVERASQSTVYCPNVDIVETEKELIVVADMPGADEKSVSVTLEDGVLTLEASVSTEAQERTADLREYGVGNYERSFRILQDVDEDSVRAVMKNGVLRVVLPKAQKPERRVVAVAAED